MIAHKIYKIKKKIEGSEPIFFYLIRLVVLRPPPILF